MIPTDIDANADGKTLIYKICMLKITRKPTMLAIMVCAVVVTKTQVSFILYGASYPSVVSCTRDLFFKFAVFFFS